VIKKLILFLTLFILTTGFLNVYKLFADSRIGDMRDKIEQEKEKQEQEKEEKEKDKEKHKHDDDDDSSGCGGCLGIFSIFSSGDDDDDSGSSGSSDSGSSGGGNSGGTSDDYDAGYSEPSGCMIGFFDMFGTIRYADHPYSGQCPYNFVGWADACPDNEKFVFLQVDLEGAYLFEETYGLNAKASMDLTLLRVTLFYQYVTEPGDYFNVFSGNAGFTIPIADGMLHLFAGFYLMDIISEMLFSFGAEFTYFLPANISLDIYSLNAFYGDLGFHTFSCSLSYSVGNLSFGGGFNYNYYAGVVFMGPMVKITVWI
jgi:hypothetical protein